MGCAKRILVVDDEYQMRIALTEALKRIGYSVTSSKDGFDALDRLEKTSFPVIITDMKMPGMDGMEMLRNVKKVSPHSQVIIITAYGTIDNAVSAIKQGAFDYLLKPFSSERLETMVKRALDEGNGHERPSGSARINGERSIITRDPQLIKIMDLMNKVAKSMATVLIQGESGTGKELFARFIHQNSKRKENPFVAVNCAALPSGLLESELFGHEKGSFTGAVSQRKGKFELANGGTLLLDEISELEMPLQAKILRVLQENELDRVGGSKPIPLDARIIATTNTDLRRAVRENNFREDLFYRLNVVPVFLPPLRERKSDIALLARFFLKKYADRNEKKISDISSETISLLLKHQFRGNVRELENLVERAALVCEENKLLPGHFFLENEEFEENKTFSLETGLTLRETERSLIFQTLKEVNDNRTRAAKILGISIRTLRNKLKEYREEKIGDLGIEG